MADTGIFDVDEDFIWTGLWDWDLLVIDRSAGFFNHLKLISFMEVMAKGRRCRNLSPLLLWNLVVGHGDVMFVVR